MDKVKKSMHLPLLQRYRTDDSKPRRRKTLMQEKREKALAESAKIGWSEEEHGNGNVVFSHDGHFEDELLPSQVGKDGFLGFFYAPWCGHCKSEKPHLVSVSEQLKEAGVKQRIVAVDAEGSKDLATKYRVTSFPTYHYFRDNKMDDSVFGENDASSTVRGRKKLLAFMMRLHDPDWTPPPPEPLSASQGGERQKTAAMWSSWTTSTSRRAAPRRFWRFSMPLGAVIARRQSQALHCQQQDARAYGCNGLRRTGRQHAKFGVSGYTLKWFRRRCGGGEPDDYAGAGTRSFSQIHQRGHRGRLRPP